MIINASQMKQGDIIQFYGAEFTLGEVFNRDGVYWSEGKSSNPSDAMLSAPYYFPKDDNGLYIWKFQGNELRQLTKIV